MPVLKPTMILAVFIAFLLSPVYGLADVYYYVDDNRIIHLTNVPMGKKYKVMIREKPLSMPAASSPFHQSSYDDLIAQMAGKYGVDDDLVKAVIKVESNFNSKAVSRKGARGLMQLMPETALSLGVTDCFHPEYNIDGGVRYLSYLLGLYHNDLHLALAAYNAGEQAVARYGGIPPYTETKTYVRLVLDSYERYRKKNGTSGNRTTPGKPSGKTSN